MKKKNWFVIPTVLKTEASLLNPRDPYNQQFDSKNLKQSNFKVTNF